MVCMDDDQDSECSTQPYEDEPLFRGRVVWIVVEERMLVCEDGPRFLKGDPVLASILGVLPRIPLRIAAPAWPNVGTA